MIPMDEPPRDPELARALHRLEGEPPLDTVDWERLHARVLARARPALGRLRARPLWWDHAARWGRIAIPLAAAAGLAIAVSLPRGGELAATGSEAGSPTALAVAYLAGAPPRETADAIVGATDRDWLLGEVLGVGAR